MHTVPARWSDCFNSSTNIQEVKSIEVIHIMIFQLLKNCVFPISQCTVSHECISPCLQLDLAYRYRYRISFYNIYIWNIIDYPIKIVYPQVTTKPCVQLRSRRPAVPKYPRPSLCRNKKLLRIPLLCRLFKKPLKFRKTSRHLMLSPFPLQVPEFFPSTVHPFPSKEFPSFWTKEPYKAWEAARGGLHVFLGHLVENCLVPNLTGMQGSKCVQNLKAERVYGILFIET